MWNSKMKDMRLWMVVVAMLAVTFFVPWSAHGVSAPSGVTPIVPNEGGITITAGDAQKTYTHYIQGDKSPVNGGISVTGGNHDIYVKNVNLTRPGMSDCSFTIKRGATVNLYLVDGSTNTFVSGKGEPGIYVEEGAVLCIHGDDGELIATGGETAAGIGGKGVNYAGTITIEGGNITATGGFGGAGIGGGSQSGVASVSIESGTVTAIGGDHLPGISAGGPGIGDASGLTGGYMGVITIGEDAEVTVQGGAPGTVKGESYGIAASQLQSSGESANFVTVNKPKGNISAAILDPTQMNTVYFNGIIKTGDIYTVYGKVTVEGNELNEKADWNANSTLVIPKDASVTVKEDDNGNGWNMQNGKITGNGTLYGRDLLSGYATIGDNIDRYPKPITSKWVTVKPQTYTGSKIEPGPSEITVKEPENGTELVCGQDYEISGYGNNVQENIEVGVGTVQIKACDESEKYTTAVPFDVMFDINPVDLSKATVETIPASGEESETYDGTAKEKPSVEVKTESGEGYLPESDYTFEWVDEEPFVDAGTYHVIVKASDNGHCTGEAEGTFEIKPRPLHIASAIAADRVYNGTTKVSLDVTSGEAGFTFQEGDIVAKEDGSLDDVKIKTDGLTGDISAPDVNSYSEVTLKQSDIEKNWDGADKGNYTIDFEGRDTITVRLDPPVVISSLVHDQPILSAKSQASSEFKDMFGCTITIDNAQEGAKYQYKCIELDNKWSDATTSKTAYFDGLQVNQSYTFYARVVKPGKNEPQNIIPQTEPSTADTGFIVKRIDMLDQEPPAKFDVSFKVNEDGTTYTATMPEMEKAMYSFDGGGTWTSLEDGGNVKTNCESGHTYLACIKYIGDATHKESEPTIVEATAPMEQVEQPAISPNGGKFKGSQKITMTCPTSDAVIYYTLDGSEPVPDGPKTQRYTEAFEITEAANIKAIATKEYMKNSRSVSAKFEWDDSLEARIKKTDLSKVEDIPSSLQEAGFSSISDITAALSRVLTAHEGYTYQNIAYYDVAIEVSSDRKTWREAKPEDFPQGGLSVTIPYPSGTTKNGNDFIAAHMFSTTDTDLGTEAGGIEEPSVSKTTSGLQMKLTGMSPLGIAWKVAAADNPTGNTNATNSSNGTGANGANGANGTAARVQADGDDNGADGADGGDAASDEDDSTADEAAENGSDSNSEDGKVGSALSSLLPQTSDGRTILLWVVLAFLSAAILLALKAKGKKD